MNGTVVPISRLDTFEHMEAPTAYARACQRHPSLEALRADVDAAADSVPDARSVPFDVAAAQDMRDQRAQQGRRQDFAEEILGYRVALVESALRDVLADPDDATAWMADWVWPAINAAEVAGEMRA